MPPVPLPTIPILKPLRDNTLTLSIPGSQPPSQEQLCLALYRALGPTAEAAGLLYEIVRLNTSDPNNGNDGEPCRYMTYTRWNGSDDDYYELQNHEDPAASYLVQKNWTDDNEHQYKALTKDLRLALWRMRILQPCADECIPRMSSSYPHVTFADQSTKEIKVYCDQKPVFGRKFLTLDPSGSYSQRALNLSPAGSSDPAPPAAILEPSSRDLKKSTWIIHVAPNVDTSLVIGLLCAFRQSLEACAEKRQLTRRASHIRRSMKNMRYAAQMERVNESFDKAGKRIKDEWVQAKASYEQGKREKAEWKAAEKKEKADKPRSRGFSGVSGWGDVVAVPIMTTGGFSAGCASAGGGCGGCGGGGVC